MTKASSRSKNNPSRSRRVVVIGVGNMLLSDEGVGVHVVNMLKNMRLPAGVEVYDCGTEGLGILGFLENADKAIIIDAVKAGGSPGGIYRFNLDEVARKDSSMKMLSLHELDLITSVEIGKLSNIYRLPRELVVIGVEPSSLEIGMELTSKVKQVVPKVIDLILEEIKKLR